ncbi:hypothetical protein SAMN05421505_103170 [Sinosporangium album]|uniref:Uncharacterized protein n=1 Tax=Sinosporangium album TaxID=504805 RepID=A0A1G7T9M8_9ACTN|nr:DUF6309 family protein [Sinosporangium album]SDG31931.1 hypothetical protein SAMN05421505_103170 [Sinosporangium album]
MKLDAKVTFDTVLRHFHEAHPRDREHEFNTNDDAEGHLKNADRLLGTWNRVLFNRHDVLSVILPWHESEGGEGPLIPKPGMPVAEAVARVRAQGEEYATLNPVCWAKLQWQATAPFSPLYLSVEPVEGVDYEELAVRRGLIHLDGLHRMIAWELWGRLSDDHTVEAYLAGAPENPPPAGPASPASDTVT